MTAERFEKILVEIVRHEPFQPFLVEYMDGRVIQVNQPVAIGGSSAGCLTADDYLLEFSCDEVLDIRLAPQEATP